LGIYLKFIFQLNNWVVNISYLLLMTVVAAFSVLSGSPVKMRYWLLPIMASLTLTLFPIAFFFSEWVVSPLQLFDARYLIPISGMLLGNSLKTNIIGLNMFFGSVRSQQELQWQMHGLGATKYEALLPIMRQTIHAAVNPTIATTATIGLVSLPGMMTGQLLAGEAPDVAIKYQIAIIIGILCISFYSVSLQTFFAYKFGFNPNHTLKEHTLKPETSGKKSRKM
jgi:putative ABC transport system permease protein